VQAGSLKLNSVLHGGSAHAAGLAAGDIVIAVDGLRADNPDTLTDRYLPGDRVQIHAFRRDELFETFLIWQEDRTPRWRLVPRAKVSDSALALRRSWLTG